MDKVEKIVFNQVRKANKNRDIKTITGDHLLKEDLWMDSISMVTLFTNLSKEFNLDIMAFGDTELVNIRYVADLAGLFRQKLPVYSH